MAMLRLEDFRGVGIYRDLDTGDLELVYGSQRFHYTAQGYQSPEEVLNGAIAHIDFLFRYEIFREKDRAA